MRTITAAARDLRVGKTRLYSLLTQTGVEPFQQGKSRMIDDAQLQILQNAIHPALDLENDPERPSGPLGRPTEQAKRSAELSESSSEPYKELVQRMSSEIGHLREMLTSERADRQKREDEVATERQNYQQMLMFVQKDVQNLRHENDRLRLLEYTKTETTESASKEKIYSRPPAEEFKVPEEPPPTARKQRGGRFVGLRLLSAAAIVGILFYAAISHGGQWLSSSLEKQISAALKIAGTEPDTR
ncbi:MAG: hypothetical protein HOA75_02840 [Deltaproteobacteria bacterium]|nr:hypothetical protein [Deltaproteobacteria bacterium]